MYLWLAPLLVLQLALLIPSVYLAVLTLTGLAYRPRGAGQSAPAQTRLAVLVPAHNEEELLPQLLASLHGGTYPQQLYDVFVVADNCTDGTAAVARAHGAYVHEREDAERAGKGYALEWLLQQIGPAGADYDGYEEG